MPNMTRARLIDDLSLMQAGRMLLDDPEAWGRRRLAVNAAGQPVDPAAGDAKCWCVAGAMLAFTPSADIRVNVWVWDRVIEGHLRANQPCTAVYFNDRRSTTHADVLAVLDRAIEACALKIDGVAP